MEVPGTRLAAMVLRNLELRDGAHRNSESSESFISYDSSSSDYSPRAYVNDGSGWVPEPGSPRFDYDLDDYQRDERHFLEAAAAGELNRVKRFLAKHSVNIDCTDGDGKTALMKAMTCCDLDVARFLLRHNAAVQLSDRNKRTAFHIAAERGVVSAVKLLLAHRHPRVDVNQMTRDRTALMLAAENGRVPVLQCLLEAGADPNMSVIRSRTQQVRRGGRVSSPSVDTAVLLAAKNGHLKAVQFLMAAQGVDMASPIREATKLLVTAATSGNSRVMQCLIEIGADLDITDQNGQTALMRAVDADHVELVFMLLEHGADFHIRDKEDQTAMSIAKYKGRRHIQNLLLQYEQAAIGGTQESSVLDENLDENQPSWFISAANVELQDGATGGIDTGLGIGEFRAKWLDADVLVKLFVAEASSTPFREAVAQWHELRHPNVIKLFGACDVGHHFFVCERPRDGSVPDYLAVCVPTDRTPWKFLHEAALGLLYLHERQILHGNLRGCNIRIGNDGQAKLADFAVSGSAQISQPFRSKSLTGPVRWQAPERLQGCQPSFASDIYSLGMCILEVVSGAVPWKYEEREETVQKQVTEHGVQFLGRPKGFANDEWSLIKRMCASSPETRPPVSTVADTLELFAAREKARLQPEPEPPVGRNMTPMDVIDIRDLNYLEEFARTDIDRYILDDFKELHVQLRQPKCRGVPTEQYKQAFLEFESALQTAAQQKRGTRLMTTRVALFQAHSFHRRAGVLWEATCKPRDIPPDREERWQQLHADHFKAYVLKVVELCQSLCSPSRTNVSAEQAGKVAGMTSEHDWSTFLGFLRAEVDLHANDYSTEQCSTITSACHAIADETLMTVMLPLTPSYYIPRAELQDYASDCNLGDGSFGSVRKAKWLDSEVVVKEVKLESDPASSSFGRWAMSACASMASTVAAESARPGGQEQRGEALRMFRREVEIWYGLSHPHIIRLFGACHVGAPFFVCEFARHGTLVEFLGEHPDQLWQKLHEAALGIQYLHEHHVTHGDLKGNNIVVGGDGLAKVTDFGLSSMADSAEQAQISGAVQWVAPECLGPDRCNASPQSDVYSLGMCIIEAMRVVAKLSCPYPWGNTDGQSVEYYVKKVRRLPSRPPNCTDDEWRLVEKMSNWDPNERLGIIAVVDKLEKLARETGQVRDLVVPYGTSADSAKAEVAAMKLLTAGSSTSDVNHDATLSSTYRRLWTRVGRADSPSSKEEDDALWRDAEFLTFIADASESTRQALAKRRGTPTIIQFTELALRGYSLHRRLDKLVTSKRLSPQADCMLDLDWKSVCASCMK